ncbi:MAG: glycosyltransferase family 2 protein [Candidatus Berkelbacteria bacterium]|nr:glycosyltransferase family 2 protein [Candidatus Berkelbacteria bacterium]
MLRKTFRATKRLKNQLTRDNLRKIIWYIREYGFGQFLTKAVEKVNFFANATQEFAFEDRRAYKHWMARNEPTQAELTMQATHRFENQPKLSIIVPTFNTPLTFLAPMVESVRNQTYSNWELCIADGSNKEETRAYLRQLTEKDERVKVEYLKTNLGIAANTNAAIKLARGEYIALLDHDDTLAPFALYEVVAALNRDPEADLLYSDEDKLTKDGKSRLKPHFKPDWSPDTLRTYNYITHLLVIKRSLLDTIGHIREGFEGSQDFDLVLRASEQAKRIVHIPKILYHWREHEHSTASNIKAKNYVSYSTNKAIAEHLDRLGIKGRILQGPLFGTCRVVYELPNKLPLVSIIIPTKDQAELLKHCLDSIINRSTYSNYEIILVDTGSIEPATQKLYLKLRKQPRVTIVNWHKPFNYSAVNNFAARQAKGDYLLFLNDDTEVTSSDWIEAMLEYAQRPDVGAVGAKLLYPDKTIQHGGVIVGLGGVAGHSHKHFPAGSFGYFGRLILPQNLSAVTAACVMISRKVFGEVGGFDEGYALAFNDIDLCLNIRQLGKLIVWTPYAELYHYESKTRGYEDTPEKIARFKKEIDRFTAKWGEFLRQGDPHYNPNLTLDREDFSLRLE